MMYVTLKSPALAATPVQGYTNQIQRPHYTGKPPSVEDITTALSFIPSDDRDTWLHVGMAIKSELGDNGFTLWNEWSKSASNYREKDAIQVWKSIKSPGKITIRTVFGLAKDNGWRRTGERRILTLAEIEHQAKIRAENELAYVNEQAEIQARQAKAADRARQIWGNAQPCFGSHPYLVKKRISSHGLRVGEWAKHLKEHDGSWRKIIIPCALLVPLFDQEGKLWNLQAIFSEKHPEIEGTKHFLAGGRKSGLAFSMGEKTQTKLICEGYATGATLHELTGHQTILAFDCGNLAHVSKMVREKYPEDKIILCADNDAHLKHNPGIAHARDAAIAIGGLLAIPPVAGDWNDFFLSGGAL